MNKKYSKSLSSPKSKKYNKSLKALFKSDVQEEVNKNPWQNIDGATNTEECKPQAQACNI